MYVYFARSFDPDTVKVGRSKNPVARVSDLQVGSATRLKLYGTVQCDSELDAVRMEKSAHAALALYCTHGEWHQWTPDVKRYIDRLLDGPGGKRPIGGDIRIESPIKPQEGISIDVAAEKYSIEPKRLRGYIWRNDLIDPIGCLTTDRVYDDWRLQRLAPFLGER